MDKRVNRDEFTTLLNKFKELKDKVRILEGKEKRPQPLLATPSCPKYGKKGHMNKKDKGLFWECECGFCWWKHDYELPKNLQYK